MKVDAEIPLPAIWIVDVGTCHPMTSLHPVISAPAMTYDRAMTFDPMVTSTTYDPETVTSAPAA